MRLKEIKPGMVIHCKNNEEKKALLEEAERLGYKWNNHCVPTDCRMLKGYGMTIHFYEKSEWTDFKHLTWSDNTEGVTEFSDLILPELTAEEVLEICHKICGEKTCNECPMSENCFARDNSDFKKVVEICEQWKADHEKKEPEIETVDICRIIEVLPDGRKRCVHEEDIPEGSNEYQKRVEILTRYIMEHDGEFIAVHETVCRVRK